MHIVVCLKAILDPELPPRSFRIDPGRPQPLAGNAARVISPFDENALELALQLRDRGHATRITALTLGEPRAVEQLRKALAVGVDEAVLLSDPAAGPDPARTATLLAAAVRRLPPAAAVFCGRQAGDWDLGQVGSLLAEALGWPCVPFVLGVDVAADEFVAEREVDGGQARVAVAPPAVFTVTNTDRNQLRMPKTRAVLAAMRRPITQWAPAEAGSPADPPPRLAVRALAPPPDVGGGCEWVADAATLAARLRELRLVPGGGGA